MSWYSRVPFRAAAFAVAALAFAASAVSPATAQPSAYPSRPIVFVVSFPPGSPTDIAARHYAAQLSKLAGQPVVVENAPGGNGFIAVRRVLSAPADGHTVLLTGGSTFSTNVVTFKSLPYDPVGDFSPVGLVSFGPTLLVVNSDSPVTSLKSLVDFPKKAGRPLNVGTAAVSYRLGAAVFFKRADIEVNNVPFKGANEVAQAVLSNTVDVGVFDLSIASQLVKSGRARALAVSSEERHRDLPEVPTFIESGYSGYTTFLWGGAAVSSKTPEVVAARLSGWFKEIAAAPETREYNRRVGFQDYPGGGEYLKRLQLEEIDRWKSIATQAGVTPQ